MATYPGGIPDLKTQAEIEPGTSDDAVLGIPKLVGDANGEIEAIASELGTNPSGSEATVKDRLDALDSTVAGKAATSALAAHEADTTNIHGIADTALLETTAGATSKASAAQSAAEATAAAALSSHHAPSSTDHDDRYYTEAEVDAALAGKSNTGHTHSYEAAGAVAAHEAAGDPHPQYETSAEAAAKVTAHEAASDPHPGYQRESEKGAANGYASLDGSTKVPFAQLPTGTSGSQVAIGDHTHPGGSGHTIRDEGTALTARGSLDFVGSGVTVTDNAGADKTVVTIPGSGAQLLSLKNVKDYGAVGDARVAWGNTSGTTVTATGSYWDASPFAPSDVGKEIHIEHGTTSGDRWLRTTITGYTSPTVVTIAASAVTGTNRTLVVGTNDTTAINNTIAACGAGEKVVFPQGWYLTDGGHTFAAYGGVQGADRETTILVTTKTDAGSLLSFPNLGASCKDLEVMYAGFVTQNSAGNRTGGAGNPIRSLRVGISVGNASWSAWTGDRLRARGFDVGIFHTDGPLFILRETDIAHCWTTALRLESPTWPDYALRRIDGLSTNNSQSWFGGSAGTTGVLWREGGSTAITNSLIQGQDYGINFDCRAQTQEVRVTGTGFEDANENSIRIYVPTGIIEREWAITGNNFANLVDKTHIHVSRAGTGTISGLTISGNSASVNTLSSQPWAYISGAREVAISGNSLGNLNGVFRKPLEIVNCTDVRHDFLYSAKLIRATNQTWGTAGNAYLAWTAEQHDLAGMHDNSVNNTRITVPITGKYRFTGQLHVSSSGTLTYAIASIFKNGSTTEDTTNMLGAAFAGPITGFQVGVFPVDTGVVELNAGDYVEIRVATDGTGTATLNKDWSWFSVEQVA